MCLLGRSGKAVADGAVAWYIRRSVTGRATRFAYGISVTRLYDPSDWRHNGRSDPEGDAIKRCWSEIVDKASSLDIVWLDALLTLKAGPHF
jgi:hypothetical protein